MGFNCNGFSIKLVKIAQDSEIRYLFAIDSRVDNSWKVTWEAHVGIWTVFCQTVFRKSLHTWPTREWPAKLSAWIILSMTLIPFTHIIYTYITHKIVRRLFRRKAWRGFYNTHLVRESYSSSRKKSLLFVLLTSLIVIPWKEICTQTQPTLI